MTKKQYDELKQGQKVFANGYNNENETLKSILNTSLTFKQKIVIYRTMKRNELLQKLHDDILTCKELTFSDYLQFGRREKESIQYYTLSDISDHLRDVILLRE